MNNPTDFKLSKILQPKLALFQQKFPNERIITVTENQGMEHYILEINNDWICKIAKGQTDGLEMENKILRFLQKKLKTRIPIIAYYEPGFLVYHKLPGVELSTQNYEFLTPTQKNQLVEDIAFFLKELHTIDITSRQSLNLGECGWPWSANKLVEYAASIQDPKIIALFQPFIYHYTAIKPTSRPALIHNDLISRNIIIDPQSGTLSGIIDFTDVAFQDVYLDLRLRWNCIPELVEAVAWKYAELINIKLDFKHIYIYYLATEFSRYIQCLQESKLDQLSEIKDRLIWATNKIK